MPRILFTADPKLPRDIAHLGYCKGMEVDLRDDEANRWLRRGVATVIAAAPNPAPAAAPQSADMTGNVVIPDDWQNQHHMARMALARKITADPVENVAAADAVISAEVEKRGLRAV